MKKMKEFYLRSSSQDLNIDIDFTKLNLNQYKIGMVIGAASTLYGYLYPKTAALTEIIPTVFLLGIQGDSF